MSTETDTRVYELGFLIVPTMAAENVPAKVSEMKDAIAKHKGEMVSEEFPKLIPLAYEMIKVISNKNHRYTEGYFGWLKFEMDPAEALAFNEEVKKDNDLIRFLLIKTVKENTVVGKRLVSKSTGARKSPKRDDEEALPVNEEELDKQIEALVDEEKEVV